MILSSGEYVYLHISFFPYGFIFLEVCTGMRGRVIHHDHRLSARIQGGDKILKYSHHRDTIDTTVDKIEREAIVTP